MLNRNNNRIIKGNKEKDRKRKNKSTIVNDAKYTNKSDYTNQKNVPLLLSLIKDLTEVQSSLVFKHKIHSI